MSGVEFRRFRLHISIEDEDDDEYENDFTQNLVITL
jgi:hypothetical protein